MLGGPFGAAARVDAAPASIWLVAAASLATGLAESEAQTALSAGLAAAGPRGHAREHGEVAGPGTLRWERTCTAAAQVWPYLLPALAPVPLAAVARAHSFLVAVVAKRFQVGER